MEDGLSMAYMFLNDWFIRNCLFATKTSIKENAASIKKFYQCMSEKKYVDIEEYKFLCKTINNNMDEFLASLEEFNNCTDEYYF